MSAAPGRIQWRPILLEAFFVVFGVVLALGANEWRQHRQLIDQAAYAQATIIDELVANRAVVEDAAMYHLTLVDSLRAYAYQSRGGAAARPSPQLFARGFVDPASVLETAWTSANATGAVQAMDYDAVLAFAGIYEAQRAYRRQSDSVGELIYARLFEAGYGGVFGELGNLASVISTFAYRECELIERYNVLLAERDAHPAEPLPPGCAYMTGR